MCTRPRKLLERRGKAANPQDFSFAKRTVLSKVLSADLALPLFSELSRKGSGYSTLWPGFSNHLRVAHLGWSVTPVFVDQMTKLLPITSESRAGNTSASLARASFEASKHCFSRYFHVSTNPY